MSWRVRRRSAVLVAAVVGGAAGNLAAQLVPPTTGGVIALDRVLQRLQEPRRLLVIAAHPDDEDTSLLSLLSLRFGADAAYLSLSRGEGGQNLIGPELGEALGLLRSRELLAARAVDGTKQFFSRAYDFGYTRSIDEAAQHWPLDTLLKDAMRVVRRFRPHVIVSVFSGTTRDGHGQHQAAGQTARAVFEAAGDSSRFPELAVEEGLEPWTPLRLYRSTRFDRNAATLTLETGAVDPRLGQSYHQVAMASRSRHRSQDMGQLQRIGPNRTGIRLLADRVVVTGSNVEEPDLFTGIPVEDADIVRFADSLRGVLSVRSLSGVGPALAERLTPDAPRDAYTRELLVEGLVIAAGIVIDGVTADGELVPGQTVTVEVNLYNGGPFEIQSPDFALTTPPGWWVTAVESSPDVAVPPGTMVTRQYAIRVPEDAPPTQPYYLTRPRQGSLYDWTNVPPAVRGQAFQPPALQVVATGTVLGARFRTTREVTYRYRDQAVGEVRREIRVVPRIDVQLRPDRLVWPADREPSRTFTATLVFHGDDPYAGEVRLEAPGWPFLPPQRFDFRRSGESQEFTFRVTPPAGVRDAAVVMRAVAVGDDGRRYDQGIQLVRYPHIRDTPRVVPAVARIRVADLTLPPVTSVGYVRGAADRVPEALAQIGVPIDVLGERDLMGDLTGYDVIVIGSRAYETDSALIRHHDRLMEYNRQGGLLLVQYQQYAFDRGDYAPFPMTINRPHDRITDETAAVRVLAPDHAVFRTPNVIDPEAWDGWPQERGLYFAGTWDDAYRPLLEMNDPGRDPVRGGLLVARHGSGTYVYTGLSFFRALPAGNPGAFKLFLNLLGLRPEGLP